MRPLIGLGAAYLSPAQMERAAQHFPYGSHVCIDRATTGWRHVLSPIPPVTYAGFCSRVNNSWFERDADPLPSPANASQSPSAIASSY